jgi:ferredoxin
MKVIVDLDVCEAHGDCVIAAPAVFDLGDEDETVTVLEPNPPESMRTEVERAVSDCPVTAIRLEED